ncbi:MAG: D-alanyl-D-alanine carboxypeptidase/D-alanyl-D-alanine-endopeptidase [Clostridia bacterium]|nr:D-alanyl-D-alanine carboxypeptidase/D-alanyl-D-alanine-endopeptidase [Deltaproteobacteria bacterium]
MLTSGLRTGSVICFALSAIGYTSALAAPRPHDQEVKKALDTQITEILAEPKLSGAKVGVYVERLDDRFPLYSKDGDQKLIPASNVKLVSTAAALHHLMPDYRFKTDVFCQVDESGVVEGNLALKGYGDPYLIPERLWYLATRIYYSGVREIKGGIVVDDSYFEGPRMANGWEQDRSSFAYMAPVGAVSLGFNALLVHVLPGPIGGAAKVWIDPASDYATLDAKVETIDKGRTDVDVEVVTEKNKQIVRVSGKITKKDSGRGWWRKIDNPPVFTGEVLKTMLAQLGVRVRGTVKVGNAPAEQTPFVSMASPRLGEVIDKVNKNSNNFMAEMIAMGLGAETFGAPASWTKAENAITSFLVNDVGIKAGSFDIKNASGLHDVNRFSPHHLVQVLGYMYGERKVRPEYMASFAIAGAAGTLNSRMKQSDATYLVRGKTGTLSNASALSAYVVSKSGEMIAFSILVNDFKASIDEIWAVQDKLALLLAATSFDDAAPTPSLPVSAVTPANTAGASATAGASNVP